MKAAAIYCRVSTDNQEREGTSLQTQLEACRNYCQDKGYDVAYRFSEAYSGLMLERPKLNELRELVRNGQVDVVVVYCLDRLSRDPTHGVILTQELEKHDVTLESVIETVDSSELGKLISYIRGFASKLEAEKIRERTIRGKKARAREGCMVGGGDRIYGYDYIKVANKNGGRRIINEIEAKWVKQIYQWLVDDGLSTKAITKRLISLNAPTKCGGLWGRSSVIAILKNPAYTGKTYAFTSAKGKKTFSKPKEEWIELSGDVTPRIIDDDLYQAAQKQLQVNSQTSARNVRREYLLRSHIYCRRCGRTYAGYTLKRCRNGKLNEVKRYQCWASKKTNLLASQCNNKSWKADTLESLVWAEIERIIDKPELIVSEIEKQRHGANQMGVLEPQLHQIDSKLKSLNRDQAKLLQWAIKDFPEELVTAENQRIIENRKNLQEQKAELERQIKAGLEAAVNLPLLERFVEMIRNKLTSLDFENKRMVLDMLGIKVWLDGNNIEITGFVPAEKDVIVTTGS